ncbi:hypothetical protein H0194_04755 [Corynebacterium incognita]|uniref:Uncharacterized protein n=1 Tax=Corynebacterium incognita TaxID=2754725 RepID=A0A7G7CRS4_9CORY|nr:hypothetical protein [Corynebacterium incognita]QNE90290.1 hypothetical protein H0194_04755 [Corynebacterium incognita]
MTSANNNHPNPVVGVRETVQQALNMLIEMHRDDAAGEYNLDPGAAFICEYVITHAHDAEFRQMWAEFTTTINSEEGE